MAAVVVNEWLDWAQTQAQHYTTFDFTNVKPSLPPASYFKFPPADLPTTLPHPTESPNYEPLFTIPSDIYNAALSPAVPITFALVYATLITYLNSVNRQRNQKPWAISKTLGFKLFVVLHNVFLSLYSLWTFIGMVRALRATVADPREHGLAGTVDSLCKMHGPRGFGAAATYNETTATWGMTNRAFHLAADGLTPDATDVGRLWNEGLAFYGWLFYISKFYEVVDTLIIIAKGKKSSFLQTYHHAGAMLCMWAGIRYMSPPIWLFVTENSFIHFIMYAFYTSTTVGIRVPKWMKQTLTTMQISQFVIGMTFAFGHYFVSYRVPVSISYIYHFGEAVASATNSVKADVSSALSEATAAASADVGSWLKKLALRAAGREGLAENVENQFGNRFGVDVVPAMRDFVNRQETRYRDDFQWVQCIDTSGQTFAIYLNLFYLVPLTVLFVQFFIKSYLKRVEERRRSSISQQALIAGKSMNDARKGVGRRLSETFEHFQGANEDSNGDVADVDAEETRKELKEVAKKVQQKSQEVFDSVSETVSKIDSDKVTQQVQSGVEQVKETSQAVGQKVKEEAQIVGEQVNDLAQQAKPSEEMKQEVEDKWTEVTGSAKKSVENMVSEETTSNAADTAEKVKEEAEQLATDAVSTLESGGANEGAKRGPSVKSKDEKGQMDVKSSGEVVQKDEGESYQRGNDEANDDLVIEPDLDGSMSSPRSSHIEHDATVQKGKSFADAAAEGVAEEDMGQTKVVKGMNTGEGDEGA